MIPHQQFPESLRRCQLLQHTLLVTSCACTANDCKDTALLSSLPNSQAQTYTCRPIQTHTYTTQTYPEPQLWLILTERVQWLQEGGCMLLHWSFC